MTIQCTVKSIEPLACNTYQILLHPEQPVDFKAGQYLLVEMGEKDKRPFSIASSPCRHGGELELHIGAAEHNAYALEVVEMMQEALKEGSHIAIDAPHGTAWVREDAERPLLLIAGGTGFSYIRSILDHCVSQQFSLPIYVYWGAKSDGQLYAKSELVSIEAANSNVHFIPVVEEASNEWQGKVGNVLEAVESDFMSLADFDIYIAGRFEMAGAARERFTAEKQAKAETMYADAYAFI
ncbi:NAD(P)H-flavin reductase [Vibrio sp. 10N.286.49.B3]|uniref:NAD(P)H-flavin reductase n=1 Tax=Vibrio sp. 10N.286.49.B3 TaxID=1880855 RepID=UPI000C83097A|nr:NAD(P)H-flavin reductase [Vibrio sp. 10N.286.49.B3]PMH38657.1 NAD(P)H-flavin reductase [Vibrio sp. 10N.286.49.B3]